MNVSLTTVEDRALRSLSTPRKIQDFLDTLPINFETTGETHHSPRMVLRTRTAHCIEGATFAALCRMHHGEKPFIMDFTTTKDDEDHVIAPFRQNGYWGAISKTNHPILRWRDPIYRTIRELALSYYHEYFMFEDGRKTLVSYSTPLNLRRFGTAWATSEDGLWWLDKALDQHPHHPLVPKDQRKFIRAADSITIQGARLTEWPKID